MHNKLNKHLSDEYSNGYFFDDGFEKENDIYYVEDDESIAPAVKEYLEQQKCKVTVFSIYVCWHDTSRYAEDVLH